MAKEILIYGTIGFDWWTGESNTAKNIIDQLKGLKETDEVNIRINSPGGDVLEGIAMYNAIANSPANITTINDGAAYSMGAILSQAGKIRKAYKNSTFLFHNASGLQWGNAQDMRNTAELLDKLDNSLIESIAQKSGQTAEEIKNKWFDYQDHTLSAQEAKDAGLIDEIIEVASKHAPDNIIKGMSAQDLFAAYASKNKPSEKKGFINQLATAIKQAWNDQFPAATPDNQITEDDMKVLITNGQAAIAQVLNITFNEGETQREVEISAEQIATIDAKLAEEAQAAAAATTAKETAEASLVTANAEIARLKVVAAKSTAPKVTKETIDDDKAPKTALDKLHEEASKGTLY